jgi:(p)ppGpp synthase/HD superfamily hydrolase
VAVPPPRSASALEFAIDAYADVDARPSKGLPHSRAVAAILVVEDTPLTVDDVRAAFGERIALMFSALTEDESIERYAQRKRTLRARIAGAEPAVMDIAVADKIASLRHASAAGVAISRRKLAHYRASLRLARAAGASAGLLEELDALLARA